MNGKEDLQPSVAPEPEASSTSSDEGLENSFKNLAVPEEHQPSSVAEREGKGDTTRTSESEEHQPNSGAKEGKPSVSEGGQNVEGSAPVTPNMEQREETRRGVAGVSTPNRLLSWTVQWDLPNLLVFRNRDPRVRRRRTRRGSAPYTHRSAEEAGHADHAPAGKITVAIEVQAEEQVPGPLKARIARGIISGIQSALRSNVSANPPMGTPWNLSRVVGIPGNDDDDDSDSNLSLHSSETVATAEDDGSDNFPLSPDDECAEMANDAGPPDTEGEDSSAGEESDTGTVKEAPKAAEGAAAASTAASATVRDVPRYVTAPMEPPAGAAAAPRPAEGRQLLPQGRARSETPMLGAFRPVPPTFPQRRRCGPNCCPPPPAPRLPDMFRFGPPNVQINRSIQVGGPAIQFGGPAIQISGPLPGPFFGQNYWQIPGGISFGPRAQPRAPTTPQRRFQPVVLPPPPPPPPRREGRLPDARLNVRSVMAHAYPIPGVLPPMDGDWAAADPECLECAVAELRRGRDRTMYEM
ncbi:formin-like protein 20 [Ischnura elegans]|uniref:formin-like protein 20 n=1 Tax=Ischnura elegans TaxID=197161 RepID=UPI001ED8B241|nr:formin-like protein 20 [Ischnura elegans]